MVYAMRYCAVRRRRKVGRRLLALVAFTLPGSALGAQAMPEVQRRDSAGVTIIDVPGELLDSLPEWRLSEQPLFALRGMDPDPELAFNRIAGAARMDVGHVVVASQFGEIGFFESNGDFEGAAGRSGEGPGEYRTITVLAPIRSLKNWGAPHGVAGGTVPPPALPLLHDAFSIAVVTAPWIRHCGDHNAARPSFSATCYRPWYPGR